ncbi:primase C-terminal domain-containing protein [Bradyrhizobium sp. WSM2254]|uniref:primase C-terminal domain-containing protein n=1 Tax=Bradyrhizobium sp. WSM2254 TaxID=1188263 RepID=UPI000486C113|nr:primase C-terminal domain-containing protein [Bradyrhizobium sp. WSM2254]
MRDAHSCDTFDDLLDVARSFNEDSCIPPLDADEVVNVARSAWKYTMEGTNRIGRHGAWLSAASLDDMVQDPYFTTLIAWLQAQNGPNARFLVADGLREKFGWPREQFRRVRRKAIRTGWIVPLTKPKPARQWNIVGVMPANRGEKETPTGLGRLSSMVHFPKDAGTHLATLMIQAQGCPREHAQRSDPVHARVNR